MVEERVAENNVLVAELKLAEVTLEQRDITYERGKA